MAFWTASTAASDTPLTSVCCTFILLISAASWYRCPYSDADLPSMYLRNSRRWDRRRLTVCGLFPLPVSHPIHFSMFWREKHFHVKSFAPVCRLSSRNLTYRSMAYLYASTV